jgi:hypothetical protein
VAPGDSVQFDRLELEGWRQFKKVEIDFHPRLTVLTGANGSGKSSILGILSQHFGWPRSFLATPKRGDGAAEYRFLAGLWEGDDADEDDLSIWMRRNPTYQNLAVVGKLKYTNGEVGIINVPTDGGSAQYNARIIPSQEVEGVFVTSNKPAQQYQQVDNIPTEPMLPALAVKEWIQLNIQRYAGGYVQHSPSYKMKQALISMAMFGPGNAFSPPVPEISAAFTGFIEVLRSILPESIGFKTLSIRTPDIVFVTDSGEWLIDEASGGISALIELAWQIFLFSNGRERFVALIDEPENHLHPSMQRRIIASLIRAFPQVQFVVATHSPFVVSSVKDSAVYVLHHEQLNRPPENSSINNEDGSEIYRTALRNKIAAQPLEAGLLAPGTRRKVISQQLDLVTKAGTASEVLRDVLGVPVTTPEWALAEVDTVVSRFRTKPFSTDTLNELRAELERLGMTDRFPEALAGLAQDR